MNRFVSVILSPGHLWSEHGVVDLERSAVIAKCADSIDADNITKVLNLRFEEQKAKAMNPALLVESSTEAMQ